jgi:hypothetical protein
MLVGQFDGRPGPSTRARAISIGGPETQLAGTLLRIKICGTPSSRLVEACVQADGSRGRGAVKETRERVCVCVVGSSSVRDEEAQLVESEYTGG